MLAFLGFAMVATLVYILITEKSNPAPAFVLIPVIAGSIALLYLMNGNPEIQFIPEFINYLKDGMGKTMPIAVMFIFSILYFSLMSDAGMFEPMVNWLVKKAGNNIVLVTMASCLIATIAHLDGALASTLLVTIPAMLPVYKKLKIRPVVLLAIIGASMSVMNLVPWGGPTARVAAILKVDVNTVWVPMIPMQVFGILLALAFSAYLGMVEKRRGAGYVEGEVLTGEAAQNAQEEDAKLPSYRRPKLFWFNLALTIIVIIMLVVFSKVPAYFPFMLGTALALVVNYSSKEQTALIKKHAANALSVPAILLASGIFLGVFSGTGMLHHLAEALIAIIPNFMGPHLPVLMGATAVPVGMMLGTDAYIFGLIPLAIEVGAKFGISATAMADAMLIGKNYGVLVTPHAATTFLAVGLAGVPLKDLFTYVFPRLWILSLIAIVFGLMIGLIPLG